MNHTPVATVVDEIQKFLTAEGSYSYGLMLLAKVNKSEALHKHLENNQNAEKLRAFLKSAIESLQEQTEIPPAPAQEIPSAAVEEKPIIKLEPKEAVPEPFNLDVDSAPFLQKIKDERVLLYRERGHLHGRLHESQSDDDRYKIARSIVKIQKEIDGLNADLRTVESGQLPKSIALKMMSAEKFKEYRNIQSYISRYQKAYDSASTDDKRDKAQAHLSSYQQKMNEFFNI